MDELFESFVKGEISQEYYERTIKHAHMIGKRIVAIEEVGHHNGNVGEKGTIILSNGDEILVEFDKNINGHDGADRRVKGKDGHCWWMQDYEWEYVESEVD